VAEAANVFKRHRALFIFLIGLVIFVAVLYIFKEPLLPFFIGFIVAYLVQPIVEWIDKKLPFKKKGHEAQRIIIILVVFLVIVALIALIVFIIWSSFIDSFSKLIADAPTLITKGLQNLGDWIESLLRNLEPMQRIQAQDYINKLGAAIGNWLQESFVTTIKFIPSTFTFVVGFLTLPFFLILFMANIHDLGKGFYTLFPSDIAYHVKNFAAILGSVAGRYIRAQLLLAVVMGALVTIALFIVGIGLAPALGLVAAAFQLIPAIGGALAAIVGCIITLAIAPDVIIWVIIIYVVINLGFGTVLIAKFQGGAVNMDASIVMILIVIGGYVSGIIGMILITPFVAVLYGLYNYVRTELKRYQLEDIPSN
jgi:predicted PurR-regulated permease PerM